MSWLPSIPIWLSITICCVSGVIWIGSSIGLRIIQKRRERRLKERVNDARRDDSSVDGDHFASGDSGDVR